ncbi:MAG: tetratricopeptide repeat protein [Acidobacteriota bacterium]
MSHVRSLFGPLLIVAVAGLVSLPFPSEAGVAQEGSDVEVVTDASFVLSFDRLWLQYREAERQGDEQRKAHLLHEMRRFRLERNTFELHDIAVCFVFKGKTHLARGELGEAEQDFRIATEFDPNLPTAYHGLAAVARQSGAVGSVRSLGYVFQGYRATFRSLWSGLYARADIFILIALALFAVMGCFAALMLYRHGVLLYHDFAERWEERFGKTGVLALTVGSLLVPVILTAGFGWLAVYWLVLTFAYQSWRERTLSVAALVTLVAATPVVEFHARWSRTLANPLFRASISSVAGTFEPTDVLVLENAVQRHPDDRDLRFLLATQYKNLGEYEHAGGQYREILTRWPDDRAARLNLGNIYFAQADMEGALLQYERAIRDNPKSVLAYYNKSLAHAGSFQFRQKEAARSRAERLDRAAVAFYDERTRLRSASGGRGRGDGPFVIDVKLGPDAILAKFFGLQQDFHTKPVTSFWSAGLLRGRGNVFLAASLLLVGLLVALEIGARRRRFTRRCWKCGSAFCRRCQIGRERGGLCTQCYHLFFIKDGVSAEVRSAKLFRVKESALRRARVFRALSIVAPGAGHIAEDATFVGAVLLWLWVGGLVLLTAGSRLYPLPDDVLELGGSGIGYLAAALLLVALATANTVGQPRLRR